MNKTVQIRNLTEATHRKLRTRAAKAGLSVSAFVRRLIDEELKKPSWDEIANRMRKLPPIILSESTAAMIRRERDKR